MDPMQTLSDLHTMVENYQGEIYKPSIQNLMGLTVGEAIIGAIFAAIIGAPLALTAGVWAAKGTVEGLSHFAITELAENYSWKKSNVVLLRAITDIVLSTALIVTAVSLGIFGTTAAAILGVIAGYFFLQNLSEAARRRKEEQLFIIPV
ncbi:MAG: hypothetical protein H0T62_08415 [Parachlamydiaceae bacterium]|nr:hypothetical protein [Parachlamydiaceae bacterium]